MRISYCSSDVCSSDLTRRKGRSISVSEDIGSDANARQDGQWDDHYWWSADGVRLHARIYPGPAAAAGAPPLLCMPGPARNARHFGALAARQQVGTGKGVAERVDLGGDGSIKTK